MSLNTPPLLPATKEHKPGASSPTDERVILKITGPLSLDELESSGLGGLLLTIPEVSSGKLRRRCTEADRARSCGVNPALSRATAMCGQC
mmetsp:Transcript_29690/g.78774  ORF Transcript_29690/g.78774 Transcript_29690/m.78774 type:complete len:90 (-) Transcript_29690:1705-1974(-)